MSPQVIANSVIVAENDTVMRNIIRSVLTRAGQQVFPVTDGTEAVRLAQQVQARLVLLDIAMPQLNGLLTCHTLRQMPLYATVPIVMITGMDDARLRAAASRLGATSYGVKPFSPRQLLALVAPFLDFPAALHEVGVQVEALPPPKHANDGATRVIWSDPATGTVRAPARGSRDDSSLATGKQIIEMYRKL